MKYVNSKKVRFLKNGKLESKRLMILYKYNKIAQIIQKT